MAKQINVGIGGVVKKIKEVPLGIGGVIKKAKKGVCSVGGVVKEFFASELVLYDGTNFTNGAVQADQYKLNYEGGTGFLSGKKLVVKFKTAIQKSSYMRFTEFGTGASSAPVYFYGPSGNYSTSNYYDIVGTWSANQEYVISKFENTSTTSKIQFQMIQSSDGLNLVFKNYISYVALRD